MYNKSDSYRVYPAKRNIKNRNIFSTKNAISNAFVMAVTLVGERTYRDAVPNQVSSKSNKNYR